MKALSQSPLARPFVSIVKRTLAKTVIRRQLADTALPPEIWIENTNRCNARCVMCPRDQHTRPQGTMGLELFGKIMADIAPHADAIKRVHLHNFGEPLLDPLLPEKIRIAKRHGIRHTYFVTNASMLTPELSRELISAGLDEFKISFYGTDRETYNATMRGLDFEKTVFNVKEFFKARQESGKNKPSVIIQYLPQSTNKSDVPGFLAMFQGLINPGLDDSMNIFTLHNFGGGRNYLENPGKPCVICDYPWRTMVILQDGKVVICCLDFNGIQVIGDVSRQSVGEIWNGPDMKKVKSDFKRLSYAKYPVCLNCERIR